MSEYEDELIDVLKSGAKDPNIKFCHDITGTCCFHLKFWTLTWYLYASDMFLLFSLISGFCERIVDKDELWPVCKYRLNTSYPERSLVFHGYYCTRVLECLVSRQLAFIIICSLWLIWAVPFYFILYLILDPEIYLSMSVSKETIVSQMSSRASNFGSRSCFYYLP